MGVEIFRSSTFRCLRPRPGFAFNSERRACENLITHVCVSLQPHSKYMCPSAAYLIWCVQQSSNGSISQALGCCIPKVTPKLARLPVVDDQLVYQPLLLVRVLQKMASKSPNQFLPSLIFCDLACCEGVGFVRRPHLLFGGVHSVATYPRGSRRAAGTAGD